MSTATVTQAGITVADIKALRTADTVSARRSGGQSQLEATRRTDKEEDIFTSDRDSTRIIPTRDRVMAYKRCETTSTEGFDPSCFAYSFGGGHNETWTTIAGLLRAGDELELEWIAGNNSGYLNAAEGVCDDGGGGITIPFKGLHHDQLRLRIIRQGKRGYLFNLADSICPDNSARMIREGCFA